jgi:uncharacterized protein YndB with AHSA1/START domain
MTAELRTFVDIDATPERVWQVLTDVPGYPEWNPFITGADGTYAVGERLSFRLTPMNPLLRVTLQAAVLEVVALRRLRFALRLAKPGVPGVLDTDHTLTLAPNDGGVRLWQELRVRGLLTPLMARALNSDRAPGFVAMDAALKDRIEGMRSTGP